MYALFIVSHILRNNHFLSAERNWLRPFFLIQRKFITRRDHQKVSDSAGYSCSHLHDEQTRILPLASFRIWNWPTKGDHFPRWEQLLLRWLGYFFPDWYFVEKCCCVLCWSLSPVYVQIIEPHIKKYAIGCIEFY